LADWPIVDVVAHEVAGLRAAEGQVLEIARERCEILAEGDPPDLPIDRAVDDFWSYQNCVSGRVWPRPNTSCTCCSVSRPAFIAQIAAVGVRPCDAADRPLHCRRPRWCTRTGNRCRYSTAGFLRRPSRRAARAPVPAPGWSQRWESSGRQHMRRGHVHRLTSLRAPAKGRTPLMLRSVTG